MIIPTVVGLAVLHWEYDPCGGGSEPFAVPGPGARARVVEEVPVDVALDLRPVVTHSKL